MNSKILIVEDEAKLREILCDYFSSKGELPVEASNGIQALELIDENEFDAVLLDIMMPELDGFSACREIKKFKDIPIIMLTAMDEEEAQVKAFELQADDYITKPFSVAEVLARIKANIRRRNQYDNVPVDTPQVFIAGELVMNLSDYTLTKNGKRVELTAKEFEILKLLMQNPKKVYTKEQIYSLVWNDAYLGDENAVNVHVSCCGQAFL